jgi:hypothetical protein
MYVCLDSVFRRFKLKPCFNFACQPDAENNLSFLTSSANGARIMAGRRRQAKKIKSLLFRLLTYILQEHAFAVRLREAAGKL